MSNLPREAPERAHYDVVIVGGAMIGSSIAWFLSDDARFNGRILVVERDPSYTSCSTAHTNSCMRQQFSTEINIRMSQFAAEYVRHFRRYMGGDERVPEVAFHSFGYLYLAATEAAAEALRQAQAVQRACGAGTWYLEPDEIARAFPFYNLDGIIGGTFNNRDEGYFDGNTLFEWWRRRARENGVEFVGNEAVGLELAPGGKKIAGVVLASGDKAGCGVLVNAAGPRAAAVARMAGVDLPVEPRKRYTFVFEARRPLGQDLPLTVDPSGVHVRTDGRYYMAGCPPDADVAVAPDDFSEDPAIWEEKAWPAIANRIPQFDELRLLNSWVGHYAYNTLDQNAIIGPHPRVHNMIFANGFSGHGFQQAPAVGRGVAELIAAGRYESLDLSPFGFERVEAGRAMTERAVI